jgi:hypothetical protein
MHMRAGNCATQGRGCSPSFSELAAYGFRRPPCSGPSSNTSKYVRNETNGSSACSPRVDGTGVESAGEN